MNYCLGFCFAVNSQAQPYVALIRKVKPDWMAGKLNGIGGALENDESGLCAMVREFREEAGGEVKTGWRAVGMLRYPAEGHTIFLYTARMDWEDFEQLRTTTKEPVEKIRLDRVWEFSPLPNLAWLVPMAKAHLEDDSLSYLTIDSR